jgi:hypothetical protein
MLYLRRRTVPRVARIVTARINLSHLPPDPRGLDRLPPNGF